MRICKLRSGIGIGNDKDRGSRDRKDATIQKNVYLLLTRFHERLHPSFHSIIVNLYSYIQYTIQYIYLQKVGAKGITIREIRVHVLEGLAQSFCPWSFIYYTNM
jgi:hypothetical protein